MIIFDEPKKILSCLCLESVLPHDGEEDKMVDASRDFSGRGRILSCIDLKKTSEVKSGSKLMKNAQIAFSCVWLAMMKH